MLMKTPGGEMLVETDETLFFNSDEGLESISAGRLISFEEASAALKKNAEFLLSAMRELSPDEVCISCGLKAGAEGGNSFWGLARVSGEASYTLTIKWKSSQSAEMNKQSG
ncbi:MAG: hypothetical protein J2P41_03270 [Blastocatellia bacterium]|nr:hypothetical protein [Blastocatellia bacterium]